MKRIIQLAILNDKTNFKDPVCSHLGESASSNPHLNSFYLFKIRIRLFILISPIEN